MGLWDKLKEYGQTAVHGIAREGYDTQLLLNSLLHSEKSPLSLLGAAIPGEAYERMGAGSREALEGKRAEVQMAMDRLAAANREASTGREVSVGGQEIPNWFVDWLENELLAGAAPEVLEAAIGGGMAMKGAKKASKSRKLVGGEPIPAGAMPHEVTDVARIPGREYKPSGRVRSQVNTPAEEIPAHAEAAQRKFRADHRGLPPDSRPALPAQAGPDAPGLPPSRTTVTTPASEVPGYAETARRKSAADRGLPEAPAAPKQLPPGKQMSGSPGAQLTGADPAATGMGARGVDPQIVERFNILRAEPSFARMTDEEILEYVEMGLNPVRGGSADLPPLSPFGRHIKEANPKISERHIRQGGPGLPPAPEAGYRGGIDPDVKGPPPTLTPGQGRQFVKTEPEMGTYGAPRKAQERVGQAKLMGQGRWTQPGSDLMSPDALILRMSQESDPSVLAELQNIFTQNYGQLAPVVPFR